MKPFFVRAATRDVIVAAVAGTHLLAAAADGNPLVQLSPVSLGCLPPFRRVPRASAPLVRSLRWCSHRSRLLAARALVRNWWKDAEIKSVAPERPSLYA